MRTYRFTSLFLFLYLLTLSAGHSQNMLQNNNLENSGLRLSGQWFLAWDADNDSHTRSNQFMLKRGYVTVSKTFNSMLSARITQDIAVDQEGDGIGDIEIRLKYGYLRYNSPDYKIFFHTFVEFGLVHRPWLDFEQKLNPYRVQGSMFLERYGISRSADYGIMAASLLGGEIDAEYQKTVNKNFPGKYGSLAVGIYNGGGYEEVEYNTNKLVEGRLSIRPLPEHLPGLQVTYAGAFGKGNSERAPDFNFNLLYFSYEQSDLILAAQYYSGLGVLQGDELDPGNQPVDHHGFSLFGELGLNRTPFKGFARYDHFDSDLYPGFWSNKRYIGGLAYYFMEKSKIIIDYDYLESREPDFGINRTFEIALEFLY